jgi:hypothetical protein
MNDIFVLGIALIAFSLFANKRELTLRGIRSSNPGKMNVSSALWSETLFAEEDSNGSYKQLSTLENGVLALYTQVTADIEKKGLNTPTKLISSYDTLKKETYIQFISDHLQITPDCKITPDLYKELITGIIKFEGGQYSSSLELIESAFDSIIYPSIDTRPTTDSL